MIECTNFGCGQESTQVIAWPMTIGPVYHVAPYCDEHGAEIRKEMGGVFAGGPALDKELASIEGLRRDKI